MKIIQRTLPEGDLSASELPPILQRIYCARGITDTSELDLSLKNLLPISSLLNVEKAAQLIVEAIQNQQTVVVVADYDADGATACTVMLRGLQAMGAARVKYVVPDRQKHGYGLSLDVVEIAQQFQPDLLITVDSGISDAEGVAAAQKYGMKVIITDHHLPGKRVPDAEVIVNPNQHGDAFESKNLAGVGVAFYLICAVQKALQHEFKPATLLDLVAVGTVADLVKLDRNNRILVENGLQRIRRGFASAGVKALLEIAGRNPTEAVAADFGFGVGPRINAAGRMEDMSTGIECLLADYPNQATELAKALNAINHHRREVEQEMRDEAEQILEELHFSEDETELPAGIALYQPHWHEGVVGIVAGRIKDRFHHPAIVFAQGAEGLLKGSARSVPGLHMRDVLEAISTANPGLIPKFGGHAMAAGLSLREADFETFRTLFDDEVKARADADLLQGTYRTDGGLSGAERTVETAEILRTAGPWGQGFEEPLFHDALELVSFRVLKEKHLKMWLRDPQSDEKVDAIAFFQSEEKLPEPGGLVEILYKLDVNVWQERRNLQLMVEEVWGD